MRHNRDVADDFDQALDNPLSERDLLVAKALREARPGGSGWARGKCPFCILRVGTEDRKGAFAVRPDNGVYTCWRCGISGKSGLDDIPVDLLQRILADVGAPQELEQLDDFHYLGWEPAFSARSTLAARSYLLKRGVETEMWAQAHIGCSIEGKWRNRIIIPVLADDQETWLGWIGRSWLKNAFLTYKYPLGFNRRDVLYNHVAVLEETDIPLLVVEGALDAIACWPYSVAALGTVSESQLQGLMQAKRPVVFVPDGDAWTKGWAWSQRLRLEGKQAGALRLPPKMDPDEIPVDVLLHAATKSLSRVDALII